MASASPRAPGRMPCRFPRCIWRDTLVALASVSGQTGLQGQALLVPSGRASPRSRRWASIATFHHRALTPSFPRLHPALDGGQFWTASLRAPRKRPSCPVRRRPGDASLPTPRASSSPPMARPAPLTSSSSLFSFPSSLPSCGCQECCLCPSLGCRVPPRGGLLPQPPPWHLVTPLLYLPALGLLQPPPLNKGHKWCALQC